MASEIFPKAKALLCVVTIALSVYLFLPVFTATSPTGLSGGFQMAWSPQGHEDSCGIYNSTQAQWYFLCYFSQYFTLHVDEVSHEISIEYFASIGKVGHYTFSILLPFSLTNSSFEYQSGTIAKWSARQLPHGYGSVVTMSYDLTSLSGQYFFPGMFYAWYKVDPITQVTSPGNYYLELPFGSQTTPWSILQQYTNRSMIWASGVPSSNSLEIVLPKDASVGQTSLGVVDDRLIHDGRQLTWETNSGFSAPIAISYQIPAELFANYKILIISGILSGLAFSTGKDLVFGLFGFVRWVRLRKRQKPDAYDYTLPQHPI